VRSPRKNAGGGKTLHIGPEEYLRKATHDDQGNVVSRPGKPYADAASVSITLSPAGTMKMCDVLKDAIKMLTDEYNEMVVTGYYKPVKAIGKRPRLEWPVTVQVKVRPRPP